MNEKVKAELDEVLAVEIVKQRLVDCVSGDGSYQIPSRIIEMSNSMYEEYIKELEREVNNDLYI